MLAYPSLPPVPPPLCSLQLWSLTQCVDSFARYAEELATTRVLKHSSESANGKCGENLAWASYDQSGELSSLVVSRTPDRCLISSTLGSEHLVARVLECPLLQNEPTIAQPRLPGDRMVVCSHLCVLRARSICRHRGSRDCGGVLHPFGGRAWQLGCSICPCCGAVFSVCPWQERRTPSMPCTSPLSLVCPSQGEVCPQPSCGEGSGKMPLAHCTAVPVCGGKRGDGTPK